MTNTFTWLHLSDLHLTCKNDGKDWTVKSINQDVVIRSLLDAIEKELIKKQQKPNLIFITGDLVHGGKAEEYQVAKEFCDQLLKITELPKQRLLIVPGNHDVNRDEIKPLHTKNWYQFENQDDVSEVLSDDDVSHILLRKLNNFYKFHNEFFDSEGSFKEHFIVAKPIEIPELNIKINLLGLNSALFAGYDGDDKKRLAFGSYQIDQALQTMDKSSILSIAFFHHPFSCFHNSEESIQNQIKQRADIILTGHLHDPNNLNQHDSSGKVVIIGAGASYETRTSENSFNLGVVNIETGEGKIQFYKYISRANRWTKNTDVNLDEDDGHFPFDLPSIKASNLSVPESKKITSTSFAQHKETRLQRATPTTPPQQSSKQVAEQIKIAILTANPINKRFEYKDLIHGFKKLKCEVYYHSLSCATLNELDGFDYIFILSKLIKNKVVIEDEYLGSNMISFKELEENIFTTELKGLFLFLNQAIDSESIAELSLPTVIYSELSKAEIQKFIFKIFKKRNITSFKDQHIANQENLELCILNNFFKPNTYKTSLPDEIDPRKTLHYVGRATDLEILCNRIIDLKNERNGFLTLKGSGGIGKTMTVKKITVELASRHFFPDGIDMESLKRIKEENRNKLRSDNSADVHRSCINDKIIHSLDSKSMIENNNGLVRLQSIMGKFAEQKLSQRDDLESIYHNAFTYNDRLIYFLSELEDSNKKLSLTLFNSLKGNFLKSITYINLFKYERYELLLYIDLVSSFFVDICTNINLIKEIKGSASLIYC